MKTSWLASLAVVGCLVAVPAGAEELVESADGNTPASCADRLYGRGEYLLWWIQDARLPAAGGGDSATTGLHDGGRFTLGYWLTAQHDFAVEGGYFFLGRQDRSLAEPGTTGLTLDDRLQSAEVNLRSIGWSSPTYQVDLLGGFRFLAFDEGLSATEGGATGRNRFYGGQLGLVGRWHLGNWSLDARGVVGLGVMDEKADLRGPLVGPDSRHSRSDFTAVPEVTLSVGRQITPHLTGYVGYTFLYASSMARPGDLLHDTDLWAQGIDLGLELRY